MYADKLPSLCWSIDNQMCNNGNMNAARFGYTLIELIVVISIVGLLVGGSIAGFNQLNQRQTLLTSAKELIVSMRRAQQQASSGVKPMSGCTTLDGYQITGATGSNSYTISAVCSNQTILVKTNNFAAGVTPTSNFSILFRSQIGSVSGTTGEFRLRYGASLQYAVQVSNSGNIADGGFK